MSKVTHIERVHPRRNLQRVVLRCLRRVPVSYEGYVSPPIQFCDGCDFGRVVQRTSDSSAPFFDSKETGPSRIRRSVGRCRKAPEIAFHAASRRSYCSMLLNICRGSAVETKVQLKHRSLRKEAARCAKNRM